MRNLALLFCMAALSCRSAEAPRSKIDPQLITMIPPDTVMLAGVRMDDVRPTPLYRKLVEQRRLPQVDAFAKETGFDPRKDVRELLVASDGKDTVLMARGNFNVRGFEGVKKSSYRGYTLFTRTEQGVEGGVALLDSATAVAGPLRVVKKAIDQFKSGNRDPAPALVARAQAIPSSNQFWSVSSGLGNMIEGSVPLTGNAANIGKIFRPLENTTIVADLRKGLNGFATGLCKTEQDAKNLGDAARGLVGLARLSVPDNQPELLRLWDGVKVDQQQRTIRIDVAIPQELIDKVVQMFDATTPNRVSPRRPVAHQPGAASSGAEFRHPESTFRLR